MLYLKSNDLDGFVYLPQLLQQKIYTIITNACGSSLLDTRTVMTNRWEIVWKTLHIGHAA